MKMKKKLMKEKKNYIWKRRKTEFFKYTFNKFSYGLSWYINSKFLWLSFKLSMFVSKYVVCILYVWVPARVQNQRINFVFFFFFFCVFLLSYVTESSSASPIHMCMLCIGFQRFIFIYFFFSIFSKSCISVYVS